MNGVNKMRSWRAGAEAPEDHWKSFTDIFATVCLMFFFIMVIFGVLSSYAKNVSNKLAEEAQALQEELQIEQLTLLKLIGEYDALDAERERLEAEKIAKEEDLNKLMNEFIALQNLQIGNMQSAKADFDAIATYRVEMYKKIESRLKGVMDIYYDEENARLVVDTNFLFDKGKYDLKQEYMDSIDKMRTVLFEIIDEYTTSAAENMVRFEGYQFIGHTDLDMDGVYNRGLSTNRANSIVNAILPAGSTEEAKYGQYFTTAGASKFQPKVGTITRQTDAEMTVNRRVEIIIRFDDRDIEKAISAITNTLLSNQTRTIGTDSLEEQDGQAPIVID